MTNDDKLYAIGIEELKRDEKMSLMIIKDMSYLLAVGQHATNFSKKYPLELAIQLRKSIAENVDDMVGTKKEEYLYRLGRITGILDLIGILNEMSEKMREDLK